MNVLFIDIDTLRPDHLGCYGYHRNTSPNMDRIAASGTRFDHYYCSDAPCLPARSALTTGQQGIHNGSIGHGGTAADLRLEGADRQFRSKLDRMSLAGSMNHAGYYTATITPFGNRHSAWHWYAGWNEILDPAGKGGGESAEEIIPTVLDWIDRNKDRDQWFLHFNIWDPHTPYRAPEEMGNPFENDPLPDWITEEVLAEHVKTVGPHTAQEVSMYSDYENPNHPRQPGKILNMDDLRRNMDGYDCGILYADQKVGEVFAKLEEHGLFEDTMIIISSDHGENQGELGIYGEHGTSDLITHRIPMIVKMPGQTKAHVDSGLHYNIDLLPTLADLNKQDHHPDWDGKSFAPALLEQKECGHDYLVLSQCAHVLQRSVRWEDYIYIRTYHDGYHLFPDEMLFNIKEDFHEQHNLAEERPELCGKGARLLEDWHTRMMKTMDTAIDPLWTVYQEGGPLHARGNLPKYCERLEATGRGWAVPELKKRHPYEFKK